jgi:hypothetical protein
LPLERVSTEKLIQINPGELPVLFIYFILSRRRLTVAAHVNLVRKFGDGHIEAVLHTVQCLRIRLVGHESDGKSLCAKTTGTGNLKLNFKKLNSLY